MSDSLGEGFRQVYERLKMEFYREVFCASHDVDASLSAVEAFSLEVIDQLGRLPQAGDRFQAEGLDVTVTRVDHRRVLEVRVAVAAKEPEPAETGAEH